MIVGRETPLASGAADLVGLSRSGHLIAVEFKTGTQNSEFRKALAQLLDYGSDLWGMRYEEFESTVTPRYFTSPHCLEQRRQFGLIFLRMRHHSYERYYPITWQRDLLFTIYVLAAVNFAPAYMRTIEYLNVSGSISQFYTVEILLFLCGGLSSI